MTHFQAIKTWFFPNKTWFHHFAGSGRPLCEASYRRWPQVLRGEGRSEGTAADHGTVHSPVQGN